MRPYQAKERQLLQTLEHEFDLLLETGAIREALAELNRLNLDLSVHICTGDGAQERDNFEL